MMNLAYDLHIHSCLSPCAHGRLCDSQVRGLQGFPDELFERARAVNSDAQLYKQAGNAVTATVSYAVAMALPESRETSEK